MSSVSLFALVTLLGVSDGIDQDAPPPQGAGDAEKRRTWRHALDESYRVSLVLKGIDGVLESIGGLLLLAVSPTTMDRSGKKHCFSMSFLRIRTTSSPAMCCT